MRLPKPLKSGDVVSERFEVLGVIGEGTTGTVFRAHEIAEDRDVALKVVHPHLSSDRQISGRFRREADILRRVRGPYLGQLMECIERDDGLLIIVLDYARGGSLEDYLERRGPLLATEAAVVTGQICAALATAHDAGVIHRDLKPANVLIDQVVSEGMSNFLTGLNLRVVDFGLAKILNGAPVGTALTEIDMIFGTPAYMSPEQVRGEELDARCDVYAAGIMLYEMLVGRVPFDSPSALGTMTAHLNEPVPNPSNEAPDRAIPAALNRVVLCALAKDREARFESTKHMGEALSAWIASAEEMEDTQASAFSGDDDLVEDTVDIQPKSTKRDAATTMQSKHSEVAVKSRANVSIRVSEAPVSSGSSGRVFDGTAPIMIRESGNERRVWTVLTVLVVISALAVGIWLGIR